MGRLLGCCAAVGSVVGVQMRVIWLCISLGSANGFVAMPHAPLSSSTPFLRQQNQQRQRQRQQQHLGQQPSPPSPRRHHCRLKLSIDAGVPPAPAVGTGGLVLGVNKYSHDSAVCLLRYDDGACLFAGEKERLTRSKHDGGDTGYLVAHALESVGARLEDVRLVVSNNHHHRVAPFEERIPWGVATGVYPESYASPENLLPGATHAEISHHLAHAWSAAALAPFESGLIVVMDGMGEAHGAMAKAEAAALSPKRSGGGDRARVNDNSDSSNGDSSRRRRSSSSSKSGSGSKQLDGATEEKEEEYYNDLRLMRELGANGELAEGAGLPGDGNPGFQQVPAELLPHEAYREAESAYTFLPGIGERRGRRGPGTGRIPSNLGLAYCLPGTLKYWNWRGIGTGTGVRCLCEVLVLVMASYWVCWHCPKGTVS